MLDNSLKDKTVTIGLIAGETSGDLLGAQLINALRSQVKQLNIVGVGGPALKEQGMQSLFDMERLSVMGFVEPLRRLPELIKMRRTLVRYFLENKPDIFIGIDSPDFNLGIEKILKNAGIPTIHYVSPSVWAWRKKRIHKIKKSVDAVLTLFPFEEKFYHANDMAAHFVGHSFADKIPLEPDQLSARRALNLDPQAVYVALLPGSRHNEILFLGEIFLKTAEQLSKSKPQLKFITNAANPARDEEFKNLHLQHTPNLPIRFYQNSSDDVLAAADFVLVTSGTATLEALLYKKPMVIAYRMARFTYSIAKYLVKIPFIGLPNILANEKLVPEFIQEDVTPEKLSQAILELIDNPQKIAKLKHSFRELHQQLKMDGSVTAANIVLNYLQKK